MTRTYQKPTSEWEHSHALEQGDELVDTNEDTPITVKSVNGDGSVEVRIWIDERHGQEYTTETYPEGDVTTALADGIFETVDGLSHELATF